MTSLAGFTSKDPDIMNAVLVFAGTRIPVRSLFDYREGGKSIDEHLRQFPSVKKAQTKAQTIVVLNAAFENMDAHAHSS